MSLLLSLRNTLHGKIHKFVKSEEGKLPQSPSSGFAARCTVGSSSYHNGGVVQYGAFSRLTFFCENLHFLFKHVIFDVSKIFHK